MVLPNPGVTTMVLLVDVDPFDHWTAPEFVTTPEVDPICILKLSIDQLSLHATSMPMASNNRANELAEWSITLEIRYLVLKVLTALLHAVGKFVSTEPV